MEARCRCPACKRLTGWDDPWAPRGPDVTCPSCGMDRLGTKLWQGHYMLNRHAFGHPRGEWCPMSEGALLRY